MNIQDAKGLALDLLPRVPTDMSARAALFAPDVVAHMSHPIDLAEGGEGLATRAYGPLARALPDVERRDDIVIAGDWNGDAWVAATGHYCGTFTADLFGIPATGGLAYLRYGELLRFRGGRVVELVALWDFVDLMRQAGVSPLPPAAGIETLVPGPATRDGVNRGIDATAGAATMDLVMRMIMGLLAYDGRTLESMDMKRFWSPTMLWYGPGGIGSNRRLKGFEDFHQRPFLIAFPDRRGGNHKTRVADGMYCATGGWPSIQATHAGPYLGHPATNRRITMRVMDWWRRDGDRLAENWVLIDLPDLFLQFGRDLFAEMRARVAEGGAR